MPSPGHRVPLGLFRATEAHTPDLNTHGVPDDLWITAPEVQSRYQDRR